MEENQFNQFNADTEDDEDRLIREGEARFAAMSPEEQAEIAKIGDALLTRMQYPGVIEAVDRAFRRDFSN